MDNKTKKSLDKRLSQIEQDIINVAHTTSRIIERIESRQDDEFANFRQHIDHVFNRINYLEKKLLK